MIKIFAKITLLATVLLASCSNKSETVTLSISQGEYLSEKLSGTEWNKVKELAIIGSLSDTDIQFLKALDNNGLEKLDLSKVINLKHLQFYFDSNNFLSITLPDNVNQIEDHTFQCCQNLREIKVSKENKNFTSVNGILFSKDTSRLIAYPAKLKLKEYTIPASVKQLGNCVFAEAIELEKINVEEGNLFFTSDNGILYNTQKSTLLAYPSGKKDTVYSLPKSVDNLNWSAFWGNKYLRSIVVEDGNNNYFSIDGLLTKKLQDNTYSLIAYPAGRATNKYKIPNKIKSIGICAFRDCNIDTLVLNTEIYDLDKWAFNNSFISEIQIPQSDHFFVEDGILYKGSTAYTCVSQKTGKSKIKSSLVLDERALQRCSFDEITIGQCMVIGPFASSYSKKLKKVKFEEGTEDVKGIGAFFCCTSLEEVELPSTLHSIGDKMFFGCINLNKLTCKSEKIPTIGFQSFHGVDLAHCTLYVPSKLLEDYRSSSNWKMFKNIKPIL